LLQAWRDTPVDGSVRVLCMADDRALEHEYWLREEFRKLSRPQLLFLSGWLASAVPWDLERAIAAAQGMPDTGQDVFARPLHVVPEHRAATD
jgi:hypothetical protein